MAHGGEAVAHAPDGRVVFVSGALPGETAPVRITESAPRFARGVLAGPVEAPSPQRIEAPPCPYFGRWPGRGLAPKTACGGCQWQHVAYAAQLAFKAEALADTLRRLGGIADPPVAPTLGMADPWHYRNHLRLRVGRDGLGMVAFDGATVLAIDLCPIAHPMVQALLDLVDPAGLPEGMQVALRAGINTGDQMIVYHAPEEGVDEIEVGEDISVALVRGGAQDWDPAGEALGWPAGGGQVEVAAGRPYLEELIAGRSFLIPPDGFFQSNTAMTEVLVEAVRAAVPAGTGTLVDVYSGVGLFATLLADRCAEVYAIEAHPAAVAAATLNASGLDHLTLVEADAFEGLAHLDLQPDVAVVDPPRAGLSRQVAELLGRTARDTIVYVSCEPSTLARDARQLVAAGWTLTGSQPIDMFPQTYHVESVSTFRR